MRTEQYDGFTIRAYSRPHTFAVLRYIGDTPHKVYDQIGARAVVSVAFNGVRVGFCCATLGLNQESTLLIARDFALGQARRITA